jgi:hypothetical protein
MGLFRLALENAPATTSAQWPDAGLGTITVGKRDVAVLG